MLGILLKNMNITSLNISVCGNDNKGGNTGSCLLASSASLIAGTILGTLANKSIRQAAGCLYGKTLRNKGKKALVEAKDKYKELLETTEKKIAKMAELRALDTSTEAGKTKAIKLQREIIELQGKVDELNNNYYRACCNLEFPKKLEIKDLGLSDEAKKDEKGVEYLKTLLEEFNKNSSKIKIAQKTCKDVGLTSSPSFCQIEMQDQAQYALFNIFNTYYNLTKTDAKNTIEYVRSSLRSLSYYFQTAQYKSKSEPKRLDAFKKFIENMKSDAKKYKLNDREKIISLLEEIQKSLNENCKTDKDFDNFLKSGLFMYTAEKEKDKTKKQINIIDTIYSTIEEAKYQVFMKEGQTAQNTQQSSQKVATK